MLHTASWKYLKYGNNVLSVYTGQYGLSLDHEMTTSHDSATAFWNLLDDGENVV
jgi:hypothetical protein